MTPSDSTSHPRRFVARLAFAVAIVALWVVVIAAALETYSRGAGLWAERHNSMILASKGLALRPDVPVVAREIPKDRSLPGMAWQADDALLPKAMRCAEACPFAEVERPDPESRESEQGRKRARNRFPQVPEPLRNAVAILHNDCVIAFGQDGRLDRAYGDLFVRAPLQWAAQGRMPIPEVLAMWQRLVEAVRAVEKKGPGRVLALDAGTGGAPVNVYLLPAPDASSAASVYAFVDVGAAWEEQALSPDSPWELPFFRYKKNLRQVKAGTGWLVDTNAFGFRNGDVAVPKPEGVFRILCVGGSTTEEGPSIEKTYPFLLGEKLRAAFPGKHIEVVNAGTSGMSTRRHAAKLAEYFRLQPDVMIFYEGVNDAAVDLPALWHRIGLARWQRLLAHSAFLRRYDSALFYPDIRQRNQDLHDMFVSNLEAIHLAAGCKGIRIVLCSIACPRTDALDKAMLDFMNYEARMHWEDPLLTFAVYAQLIRMLNEDIATYCRDESVPYVPVAEAFGGEPGYFLDICHMTEAGIERKAEVIFQSTRGYLETAFAKAAP